MTGNELSQNKALDLLASLQPCQIPEVRSLEDDKKEQTGERDTAKNMIGDRALADVLPETRPCFQKACNEQWEAEGDAGHHFRLASLRELLAYKASRNAIHDYFKNLSKYNAAETRASTTQRINRKRHTHQRPQRYYRGFLSVRSFSITTATPSFVWLWMDIKKCGLSTARTLSDSLLDSTS